MTLIDYASAKARRGGVCPKLPRRVRITELEYVAALCGKERYSTRVGTAVSTTTDCRGILMYLVVFKGRDGSTTEWYYYQEEVEFLWLRKRAKVFPFRRA